MMYETKEALDRYLESMRRPGSGSEELKTAYEKTVSMYTWRSE